MILKFEKIRDVKSPVYGTKGAAGMDFFIPNDLVKMRIKSGGDILIPSGLKVVDFEPGYHIDMRSRSSESSTTSSKRLAGFNPKGSIGGLDVDGLIDSDYRGEIFIHVINRNPFDVIVEPGHKIAQGVVVRSEPVDLEVFAEGTAYVCGTETARGSGGFGSTNR